jgi:hypothetical protein
MRPKPEYWKQCLDALEFHDHKVLNQKVYPKSRIEFQAIVQLEELLR